MIFAGHRRYLHRQEVPVHGKRLHPWSYSDWTSPEDEDAADHCHSERLPPLHQEIQQIRETTPEHVCPLVTMFQVQI